MFADLKNDFVFRKVFASHPDLTAALLNDLLDRRGPERIVSLSLLSPEQTPLVTGAKLSILDLKARDQSGRTFVVEMQLLHVAGFLNRVVFNACKTYAGQLGAGQSYTALADVIAVSLCDFVIWPDRAAPDALADSDDARPTSSAGWQVPLVSRWIMRERVSGHEDLTQVQYAFVELPKVSPAGPLTTPAERWAWLFKYGLNLDTIPPGLSREQRSALELAQEATFTAVETEAYRRTTDEIQQARDLATEAARSGEARGREEGRRALQSAIEDLAELLGLELTESRRASLASLDLAGLEAMRLYLKQHRTWPV